MKETVGPWEIQSGKYRRHGGAPAVFSCRFFDTEESENTIGSGILNVAAAVGWTCLPVCTVRVSGSKRGEYDREYNWKTGI